MGLPVFAFLSLLLKVPMIRRGSLVFSAITILAIIPLVAGIQPPLEDLYRWAATMIPAASILFRDPYQKFGFWLPIAYATLIGATFLTLVGKKGVRGEPTELITHSIVRQHWKKIVVLTLLLLLLTIGYAWPMFTGDVIPEQTSTVPSGRIQIPDYYYQAA